MSGASEKLARLDAAMTSGLWKLGFDDGSGRKWADAFGNRNRESGYIISEQKRGEKIVHRGGQDSWGSLLGIERKRDATAWIALRNALPQIVQVVAEAERQVAESPDQRRLCAALVLLSETLDV